MRLIAFESYCVSWDLTSKPKIRVPFYTPFFVLSIHWADSLLCGTACLWMENCGSPQRVVVFGGFASNKDKPISQFTVYSYEIKLLI
jgi:hypothetical protein